MSDFLANLPRLNPELSHIVDLRRWEDPDAVDELLTFEEVRRRSENLYDFGEQYTEEEYVEQAVRLMAAAVKVARSMDDSDQKGRLCLYHLIRFWEAHLRTMRVPILAPEM